MSASVHAVAAHHVFDGLALHEDTAVLIDGDRIAAIVPRSEVPGTIPVRELPDNAWLAPGFIDIQVNGGGDVLFNDAPTPDAIRAIAAAHRKFGTTALLPTLISDSKEKMVAALAAVESLVGVEPGVLGIHLEGPFLSPEKPGVHDPRMLRRPTPEDLALLTAPRKGVTLVTLASRRSAGAFHRQACRRRRARFARPFDGDLSRRRKPRWPPGSPASRISSMPCGRWKPRAGTDRGGTGIRRKLAMA